jgi:uncharacterized protein (TIGR03085 family)
MSLARTERAALADLFAELGPDQPTLCEGWRTKDMLVHLLVRENSPLGAVGNRVGALRHFTDQASAEYGRRPWSELIDQYRSGPPGWNPTSWGKLDELTNNGEMFIHHEDVRRGQSGWCPRTFDAGTTRVLEGIVDSALSRLALRHAGVGVVAELPGRTVNLRKPKDGAGTVTVAGEAGELVMWISGRDAALVEMRGDEGSVSALRTTKRGG